MRPGQTWSSTVIHPWKSTTMSSISSKLFLRILLWGLLVSDVLWTWHPYFDSWLNIDFMDWDDHFKELTGAPLHSLQWDEPRWNFQPLQAIIFQFLVSQVTPVLDHVLIANTSQTPGYVIPFSKYCRYVYIYIHTCIIPLEIPLNQLVYHKIYNLNWGFYEAVSAKYMRLLVFASCIPIKFPYFRIFYPHVQTKHVAGFLEMVWIPSHQGVQH